MICVPIKQKTVSAALNTLCQAEREADLVEIWCDVLEADDLATILKRCKLPVICKTSPAGIDKVLKWKPEYIDLDVTTPPAVISTVKKKSPTTKLIISFHDFKKTPPSVELKKLIRKMCQLGADIVKIATQAANISDSIMVMELLQQTTKKGQKAIFLCMGKEGRLTRTAGHLFGNYLMYAPLKNSDKTAPGQLTVRELQKIIMGL